MSDVEGTHAAGATPLALFYRTPGPMQGNPAGRRHHPGTFRDNSSGFGPDRQRRAGCVFCGVEESSFAGKRGKSLLRDKRRGLSSLRLRLRKEIDTSSKMYYSMSYKETLTMPITVRLDHTTEQKLALRAKREGVTKSLLVRRSLQSYLEETEKTPTPWELGKDLFGLYGSANGDLSIRGEEILGNKIRDKAHAKKRAR
jgi:hypothetical protein